MAEPLVPMLLYGAPTLGAFLGRRKSVRRGALAVALACAIYMVFSLIGLAAGGSAVESIFYPVIFATGPLAGYFLADRLQKRRAINAAKNGAGHQQG